MTDDFKFDPRSGELKRDGKLAPLKRLHAAIFKLLEQGRIDHQFVSAPQIAVAVHSPLHDIVREIRHLRRKIHPLGIDIKAHTGRGYYIALRDVPKWQPNIPPPFVLEGERR